MWVQVWCVCVHLLYAYVHLCVCSQLCSALYVCVVYVESNLDVNDQSVPLVIRIEQLGCSSPKWVLRNEKRNKYKDNAKVRSEIVIVLGMATG